MIFVAIFIICLLGICIISGVGVAAITYDPAPKLPPDIAAEQRVGWAWILLAMFVGFACAFIGGNIGGRR